MIEAPFCFFQLKTERGIGDAFELGEPDFCKSPEALDLIEKYITLLRTRPSSDQFESVHSLSRQARYSLANHLN